MQQLSCNLSYALKKRWLSTNFKKQLSTAMLSWKLQVLIKNVYTSKIWLIVAGMVGGSIGLLLGFSFITGWELVFFLFDYITTPMYIRASRKHFGDEWRKARKGVLIWNYSSCLVGLHLFLYENNETKMTGGNGKTWIEIRNVQHHWLICL